MEQSTVLRPANDSYRKRDDAQNAQGPRGLKCLHRSPSLVLNNLLTRGVRSNN